jgi:predicted DNA-binding transcriptional regulator YafY
LDRIEDVEVLSRIASRPESFSLQAYADQSFGIYQDDVEDVVLHITASAAAAAKSWRFHVGQTVEAQPDGSVKVSFRASGMRELAWHLFTWGAAVQIEAPDRLRRLLLEQVDQVALAHRASSS